MNKQHDVITIRSRSDLFIEEYFKSGNATESAMKVFNCSTRESAQAMGSYYLKQAKPMIRMIMDEKGITFGKLIDLLIVKMEGTNSNKVSVECFDRLMKIGEYNY